MINALFSSKSDGTKLFQRGQHHGVFGWDSIVAMYQREVCRAKQNLTRMVPRLKEVHVVRDSWTKLNVSPAKIMQVNLLVYCEFNFWYSKNKSWENCFGTATKTHHQLMPMLLMKHGSICKRVIDYLKLDFYPMIK